MNIKIWLIAAGCFVAFQAGAEPSCKLDLNKKPYYRLELTVSSTFCKSKGNQNDPSCKDFPKEGAIQLHGLWPNYAQGYPQGVCNTSECPPNRPTYCDYPSPPNLYESGGWKTMEGYMAGLEKCLERHEWVKHGICSPMAAPTYFEWSLAKAKEISEAVSPYVDKKIDRKTFNKIIADKLPEVNGAVRRLKCSGTNLYSMSVFYKWGDTPQEVIPTTSGQNSFGNCKKTFRIPSK
jgi:ribonuclease T2